MASVAQRAAPPEPSPYAQPHHFSLSANPDAPKTTEARRRRAAAEEVERCNAFIASRLEALKREPPSRFHAPDGDLSLKPKHKRGPKGPRAADRRKPTWDDGSSRPRTGVSADVRRLVAGTGASDASSISGTANARPVSDAPPARRTWPVRLQPSAHPTPSERHEVEMQNANLRRRLANQYAAGRDSQLVREGKGRPVDGLAMWARRLAIYDATDARRGDARASAKHETRGRKLLRATPSSRGVDPRTGKCAVTGVPKTLGVGRCSATGLYTYFAADGHRLREHPDVPNLFYCEKWYDDFRKMDAKMQRAIVEWHASRAKGRATDPGFGGGGGAAASARLPEWKPVRPACESWVVNRHMKLALSLMRRLAKGAEEGLTMREVEDRVAKCAAAEKSRDAAARAAQKAIDDDAATERAAVRADAEERLATTQANADGVAVVTATPSVPEPPKNADIASDAERKRSETSTGNGTRPSRRAAALLSRDATTRASNSD